MLQLQFVRKYLTWLEAQWAYILFSDEFKFSIRGVDERAHVCKRQRERFVSACMAGRVTFGGGSIIVWGAQSLSL